MKRDPRLRGLSGDHHRALVLARSLRRRLDTGEELEPLAAEARSAYESELRAHFDVEEELLLPGLRDTDAEPLADRTLREHAAMAADLDAANDGERDALRRFAILLGEHVRFEESQLFPACERLLPDGTLEEAAMRRPKRSGTAD
ncbi:MAG: hemerythrin domain-containing protein [Myxococcales bacterium]|nr:hemerythrin domain-containing protein [Myxococcales bacterium]